MARPHGGATERQSGVARHVYRLQTADFFDPTAGLGRSLDAAGPAATGSCRRHKRGPQALGPARTGLGFVRAADPGLGAAARRALAPPRRPLRAHAQRPRAAVLPRRSGAGRRARTVPSVGRPQPIRAERFGRAHGGAPGAAAPKARSATAVYRRRRRFLGQGFIRGSTRADFLRIAGPAARAPALRRPLAHHL